MLRLDQLGLDLRGIEAWKDHRNPNLYWYVPARPRFALDDDGRPAVQLTRWREPDGDGNGGLLQVTVELAVDDGDLVDLHDAVTTIGEPAGTVLLGPAPLEEVRFALRVVDGSYRGLELNADEGAAGSSWRRTYSVALDVGLATVFEQAMEAGFLPVVVEARAVLPGAELVWDGVERLEVASREVERSAQGQGLGQIGEPEAHIRQLDGTDPFFETLEVEVALDGELADFGLSAVEVQWRYAPDTDGEVVKAVMLGRGGERIARFRAFLHESGRRDYQLRTRAYADPSSGWLGSQTEWTSPWTEGVAARVELQAGSLAPSLDVGFELGLVDPDEVKLVQVDVSIQDEQNGVKLSNSLLLRPEEQPGPQGPARIRAHLADVTTTRATWRALWSLAGGQRHQGDWQPIEGGAVLVGSPFTGRRQLRTWPAWQGEALEAVVDYRYHEELSGYRQDDVIRADADGAETIDFPTIDGQESRLDYSVTLVRTDGSVHQVSKLEPRGDVLLLTDAPWVERPVEIRVPAALFGDEVAAVEVELRSTGVDVPDVARVQLRPGPEGGDRRGRAVLVYPSDASFVWDYRVHLISRRAARTPFGKGSGKGPVLTIEA